MFAFIGSLLPLSSASWSIPLFSNVTVELQVLKSKEPSLGLSDVERDRRVEIKAEIGRLLMAEETSWRQKSRATWLSDGDRNTAFFHCMANAHRQFNYIGKIRVDEVLHESQDYSGAFWRRGSFRSVDGDERGQGTKTGWILYSIPSTLLVSGKIGHYGYFRAYQPYWMHLQSVGQGFCKEDGQGDGYVDIEKSERFRGGRQVLDASLVANECMDGRLKSKEPGVLCKLDIEKAYDQASRDFMLYLLKRLGFEEIWCNWIKSCISSVKFSVLDNGSAPGFFGGSRGLRQGYPLSSFLFIIVMDVLSKFISRAVSLGRLSSFKTQGNWLYLRDILLCFQVVSGLKIILAKSELTQVGDGIDLRSLVATLGCKSILLPIMYLGLPLGSPYKSKVVWGPVVERFERRLASWKHQYLSKWGFMPSEEGGGLGIRDIDLFNKALLGKWIWRFALGEDKLWCRVIKVKYGSFRGDWRTKDIAHSHGTGLWKGIMKAWGDFCPHVAYQLGNGSKIIFWHDEWCSLMPLQDRFPELFALATNQDVLLQEEKPISQELDKWRWKRQCKGSFTVASFYHALTRLGDPTFPWKGILVSKLPSKVCFFDWAAARGAIMTIDNLRRRRIVVTKWCYMCWGETRNLRIIFSSTVGQLVSYGAWFSPFLGCSGLCSGQSRSSSRAGVRWAVRAVKG
ncbi:hypothetical protein Acr_21g0003650 [Actinidia rufa]|uniref:Reverse transcriptase domain-containing protein n=1 Tax=Actinidia rufa TaxID=165716 RepID=A0A7J0GG36_9ERIC|nr:hypothetical protein Acr_21g0003650 [Actinidia rufa]